MFCTNCGTKQVQGAEFCVNCGTKLGEVKDVQKQVSTPKITKTKGIAIAAALVIIIVVVIIVRSCGSGNLENQLVGTWNNGDGITLVFERGGGFQEREFGETFRGTWEIDEENTLYFDFIFWNDYLTWAEDEENVRWSEWFLDGNRLHIGRDVFTRR
jgi:hypothetical protein